MDLEFQDHYVLAVIALLWGLCFCRNILESCSTCLRMADGCIDGNLCCVKSCIEFYNTSQLAELVRQTVIVFCFLQPIFYCAIYLLNKSRLVPPASSVVLHNVRINGSSIAYRHGNASHAQAVQVEDWNLVEIDYLFIVLPFATLVSVTSLLWVHCINVRDINASTTWDSQMPESVFFYEAVYYVELWAMNVSFIAACASERSVLEVHYTAMALSCMLTYSISQSKYETEHSVLEHTLSMFVSLCYFSVLVPLWLEMVQTACYVAVALAVVHAAILLVLVSFHSLARGQLPASQILLVRIMCTVAACVTHLSVYATGRNEHC